MNYCIRGNRKRGAEVIAILESKGGVNKYNCTGAFKDNLYFINKEGIISTCDVSVANTVYELCVNLTLPKKEWKPTYKIGAEIQTAHTHKKGTIISIDSEDETYRIEFRDSGCYWCNENEIEPYKWTPKRGETVLVRQDKYLPWKEGVFSFYHESAEIYCVVGGIYYKDCIQFDLNKLGKVTEE